MTLSFGEVIKRFANPKYEHSKASSVFFKDRNTIYSFGTHFPLALRGEFGATDGEYNYLINGDYYSVTTSQHQNCAISSLRPNVIIPFSALEGAGIKLNTIKVVARREDETYETCSVCGKVVTHDVEWVEVHDDDKTPLCPDAKISWHHILGAVVLTAETYAQAKREYYLSGVDENEPLRSRNAAYFLCKLPREVVSIDDAYESLKPLAVQLAYKWGEDVKRQGDIFAVPTTSLTKDIKCPTQKRARVFNADGNASHTVSELRVYEDMAEDIVYARGVLRHEPQGWRRPQHKRVLLGKVWHALYKNLAQGSWSAQGNVD
jgi:hypothetical protein